MHVDHLPGSFFGPSTLVELLRHRAAHQPRDLAFCYLVDGENEEVRITYQELDQQARAIAAWLQSMNLAGERALLLYPAGLEFIAAFFGCLYAGVVAVPGFPPRRNRSLSRIQAIADDAQAKLALTTAQVWDRVQLVLDETPDLKKIIWLSTDRAPEGIFQQWTDPDVHGDTLAFLQYTSGSTGTPKGVMLTHANLMHNSALISYAFEHTRSGIGVFWLPMYHDMGLIGGILQPMYLGRPNVLMSPMAFLQKPFRWLQAISKYRATISGGPNFAYELCARKVTPEQRAALDLSAWSLAFNGAEPIRAETIGEFCRLFEPCGFKRRAFYPCYGLAEATLIVTGGFKTALPVVRSFDGQALELGQVQDAVADEDGARELVGCGNVLLDQKLLIVQPDTRHICGEDQVGEIWVSGPSVAQGYWRQEETTAETFRGYLQDTGDGPFLRTGDLGFVRSGELFITGRRKDLIIIRGRNHYPQDIELTAEKSHPQLRAHSGAAFAVEVDGRERLALVYEVERGQPRGEEIFAAVRKAVSGEHDLPVEAITLVKAGSIPKTSSGKIQRHACKAGFLDGSLEAVAQWRSWSPPTAAEPAGNGQPGSVVRRRFQLESAALKANGAAPAVETVSPATQIVIDQVRRVARERAVGLTLDTNIVELGLDSIERMEIVAALEERFGGRLPEDVLPQIETCREVAAAVEKYLGKVPQQRRYIAPAEIAPECYQFDQFPEIVRLRDSFREAQESGLANPYFQVHESVIGSTTRIGGRELVSYASYNYLGLSGDPRVSRAAKEAVDRFGTSASASRLVSGEKSVHQEFEQAVAEFLGTEAAIAFISGHGTNETTIGHLVGAGDLILHDALAHNSILQGAIMSGARRRAFPHNDAGALAELLSELRPAYRRVLVAVEGVYSMDGDICPLPELIEIKQRHKALLYVDEAHSIGVLGETGRGVAEHFAVRRSDVDVWMGTLSKAFASTGGYIAGSAALVQYLKYTAPGFVFSAALAPPNAAAALAALQAIDAEPQRVRRLQQRAALFLSLARQRGLNTGLSAGTPIVPLILGNSLHALRLSQALFARGVNVQPILYPAVEERASRLRFFLTADHTPEQIHQTIDAVCEELARIDERHLAGGWQTELTTAAAAALDEPASTG